MAKSKPTAAATAAVAAALASAASAKGADVVDTTVPAGFQEPVAGGVVTTNPAVPSAKELAAKEKAAEKAEKAAAIAAKKEAAATEKTAKAAERAKSKAERQAAHDQLVAEGKVDGPMLALAARVKAGAYVKGATGQLRSSDDLALALDGVSPTDVVRIGLDLLKIEDNPYSALNTGQQSMNLRNRMRGAIKKEVIKLSDIADYISRNKIVVVTIADREAEAKARAEKAQAKKDEAAVKKAAKPAITPTGADDAKA